MRRRERNGVNMMRGVGARERRRAAQSYPSCQAPRAAPREWHVAPQRGIGRRSTWALSSRSRPRSRALPPQSFPRPRCDRHFFQGSRSRAKSHWRIKRPAPLETQPSHASRTGSSGIPGGELPLTPGTPASRSHLGVCQRLVRYLRSSVCRLAKPTWINPRSMKP